MATYFDDQETKLRRFNDRFAPPSSRSAEAAGQRRLGLRGGTTLAQAKAKPAGTTTTQLFQTTPGTFSAATPKVPAVGRGTQLGLRLEPVGMFGSGLPQAAQSVEADRVRAEAEARRNAPAPARPQPGQAQVLDVTDPMRPPAGPSRVNPSINPFQTVTSDPASVQQLTQLRDLLTAENFGYDAATKRNIGYSPEAQKLINRLKAAGISDPVTAVRGTNPVTTPDPARNIQGTREAIQARQAEAQINRLMDPAQNPNARQGDLFGAPEQAAGEIEGRINTPQDRALLGQTPEMERLVNERMNLLGQESPEAARAARSELNTMESNIRNLDAQKQDLLRAGRPATDPSVIDLETKIKNSLLEYNRTVNRLIAPGAEPGLKANVQSTVQEAVQNAAEQAPKTAEKAGRTIRNTFEGAKTGFTGEVAASAGGQLPPLEGLEADIANAKASTNPTLRENLAARLEAGVEWARNLPENAAPQLQELKQAILEQYDSLKGRIGNTIDKMQVGELKKTVTQLNEQWNRANLKDISIPELEDLKRVVDKVGARANELGDVSKKSYEKFAKKVNDLYSKKIGGGEAPPPKEPGKVRSGLNKTGRAFLSKPAIGAAIAGDMTKAMALEMEELRKQDRANGVERDTSDYAATALGNIYDHMVGGFGDVIAGNDQMLQELGLDSNPEIAAMLAGAQVFAADIPSMVFTGAGNLYDVGRAGLGAALDYFGPDELTQGTDFLDRFAGNLRALEGGSAVGDTLRGVGDALNVSGGVAERGRQALESPGTLARTPTASSTTASAPAATTLADPNGPATAKPIIETARDAEDQGVREVGRYGLRNQPIYGYKTLDSERAEFGDAIFSDTPQGAVPEEFNNPASPFRGGLGGRGYNRKAEADLVAQRRADTQAQLDKNRKAIDEARDSRERTRLLRRISRGGKGRTREERNASLAASVEALRALESTRQQAISSEANKDVAQTQAAAAAAKVQYDLSKDQQKAFRSAFQDFYSGKEGTASTLLQSAISGNVADRAAVDQILRTEVSNALKTSGLFSYLPADEIPSPQDKNFWKLLRSDDRFFLQQEIESGGSLRTGWLESDVGKSQLIDRLEEKGVDPSVAEMWWNYIFNNLEEAE